MQLNSFPYIRLRRNRKKQFIRDLVQENRVSTKDLVYPVFIIDGKNRKIPIPSMPNIYRLSIDHVLYTAELCIKLGIPAIALFPVIEDDSLRDTLGMEAYNPDGLIP